MLADFHVHTGYSDDSIYPLRQVANDAVKLNLDEICFTEHVDYGIKPEWDNPAGARFEAGRPMTNCAYEPYLHEIDQVRSELAGKIKIRAGLELGVQTVTQEQNSALVNRLGDRLDFVICSVHQVDNLEFWNGDFQAVHPGTETRKTYYQELLKLVETYHDYDVLGHLDLIRRYDPAGECPFAEIRDIVAAILERVIADGKGIEINTSGIRYKLDGFMPSREILALYRDLGGTIVTTGSDSHKPEHLGAYLRAAQNELASLGFESFCTYEHRQPVFHKIV